MATTPPLPELPYMKVDAFKIGGRVYETEREALVAAIAAVLERTDKVSSADGIYEAGSAILPLLQRAIAVRSAAMATSLSPITGPLDRNGFDTTPRARPPGYYEPVVTPGERSAAAAMEEALVEMEAVEGYFQPAHSAPVYHFIKRWRQMDHRLFTEDFHNRAQAILARDAEAGVNVPGYIARGGGALSE